MSTTVGMDIDWTPAPLPLEGEEQTAARKEEWLKKVPELVLSKKDELGLLMLERSATKGYHLVFRRRPELSQEENLKWASELLGVDFDKGAKDITRVFFTTSASEEDLIYLDDEIFGPSPRSPKGESYKAAETSSLGESYKAAGGGLFYNGIPYTLIVNALLAAFGYKDGNVPMGARNTTLYRLARQLRYICDFNPAFIRSVVPDWGLSAEEVQQTVLSAVGSTRATDFPPELKNAINEISKPDLSTPAKRQEYLQRLNPLPQKMPKLLRYIYKRYGRNGRSALVAALPMLGTLLGRFESKYLDGRKHRPVFMVAVCGHAGSGKGFIADMQEWLLKPVLEDDAKGRAELDAYNREKEKKRGAKQLPDKPTPCIRCISATSSNGYLLTTAQNALGQPLCVVTEEIDESNRANKAGAWADKSDIFRKAFDGSSWGQDYLTYNGSVHVFLNLLFAGTYVSVRNYFRNVENGLMTRFFFTEMARDLGKNVEMRLEKETKEDREAQQIVQDLYQMGSTTDMPEGENVVSFPLPAAKKNAYRFNEEKIAEWEASGPDEDHRDNAIDLLRRRAAVFIFRASQIMYALEGCKETAVGQEMARWYGNESYLNQYIMFGDAINESQRENEAIQKKQDLAASRVARNNTLFQLLDRLPDEFTPDDLKQLMAQKGMNSAGRHVYLKRMIDRELIMQTPSGYKKISDL